MSWIDRLRRKESPTAGVTLGIAGGRPITSPRNTKEFARVGYGGNVDVYAAIEVVALAGGGIDWYPDRNGQALEAHETLTMWNRPNPGGPGGTVSGTQLVADLIRWECIAGEWFIAAVGPDRGKPRELWVLEPNLVEIIPGTSAAEPIAGYRYKNGSRSHTFTSNEVLHSKLFNPLDPWRGLSPLHVAALLIDQAEASAKYNLGLAQNGGVPPGFLKTSEKLNDKQFKRLRKQMRTQWGRAKDAGLPELLEAGMEYQSVGRTPKDMEYLAAQQHYALKFAQVIGVPAEFLSGAGEKKYANYPEARKALYTEAVLPRLDRIRDAINPWLAQWWTDGVTLEYNPDDIEALQEQRDKVWSRVGAADYLTVNEKREAVGLPSVPGGDVILVSATLIPVGDAAATVDPAAADSSTKTKALNLGTAEAKAEHWKLVDAQRRRLETNMAKLISSVLDEERALIVDAISGAAGETSAKAAVDLALREHRSAWTDAYKRLYLTVGKVFAEATLRELKTAPGPQRLRAAQTWESYVLAYVKRTSGAKVKGIEDTRREQLKTFIETAIANGDSIPTIAKSVDELYLEQIIPNRSRTIARTETIAASNAGSVGAAKSTGLPLTKEWISTADERTRDAHQDVDNVGLEELFIIDGNELEFPGDADHGADADQVVNCRCTVAYQTEAS